MSNLTSILSTARSGLYAQQTGIAITGNNIANINTEGYTRQRTNLNSLVYGGVTVSGVSRLTDEFATARLLGCNADVGNSSTLATNLQQVEGALGESAEEGISSSVEDFFNAWQDLTGKPAGTTERESVRQNAKQLIADLQSITSNIKDLQQQVNTQVKQQVDQVNNLTGQIADLNRQLLSLPATVDANQSSSRNALLDQRDQLVNELSSLVKVKTITDDTGSVTVFMGQQTLVSNVSSASLSATPNDSNGAFYDVTVKSVGGSLTLDADSLGGSLGALIESRDSYAADALNETERIAAKLARDVNVQHRAGTGLDGVSGRDFFAGLSVTAKIDSANNGGEDVSSSQILDDTQLTFDDYEIRFTTSGTYDVYDVTSGTAVSTGNSYTSGGNIDFDGMRVVVSDSTGTPQAGDVISVNSYAGTCENLSLSAAVENDTQAIAAGTTSATGDNTNATAIAQLATAQTMGSPATQTYTECYDALRTRISNAAATAQSNETNQTNTQTQAKNLLASTAGVSSDEEATNLIQYQSAYAASSRVVSVVQQMMDTLVNMIS